MQRKVRNSVSQVVCDNRRLWFLPPSQIQGTCKTPGEWDCEGDLPATSAGTRYHATRDVKEGNGRGDQRLPVGVLQKQLETSPG